MQNRWYHHLKSVTWTTWWRELLASAISSDTCALVQKTRYYGNMWYWDLLGWEVKLQLNASTLTPSPFQDANPAKSSFETNNFKGGFRRLQYILHKTTSSDTSHDCYKTIIYYHPKLFVYKIESKVMPSRSDGPEHPATDRGRFASNRRRPRFKSNLIIGITYNEDNLEISQSIGIVGKCKFPSL